MSIIKTTVVEFTANGSSLVTFRVEFANTFHEKTWKSVVPQTIFFSSRDFDSAHGSYVLANP